MKDVQLSSTNHLHSDCFLLILGFAMKTKKRLFLIQ